MNQRLAVRFLLPIGLLAVALIVATRGWDYHPLDVHETYVVRTANEMVRHHEWIVPYFNDELRLNKPPLAYWASRLIASLSGSPELIKIWHARAVSAFAGIGIVLLTVFVLKRLAGATAGFIAGGIAISSMWYFSYTHDARVDMLYSFLVFAQQVCFVGLVSKEKFPEWPDKSLLILMWLSIGLAILAKGPHIPLLVLTGHILYLLIRGHRSSAILKTINPLIGVISVLFIVLPWWLMLKFRLHGVELSHEQVSGTLLLPSLENLKNSYYLLKLPLLLVPWLALGVFVLVKISRYLREDDLRSKLLLFLLPFVCIFLGLAFGVQVRQVYLLPAMPMASAIFGIVLARGIEETRTKSPWHSLLRLCLMLQSLITVGLVWRFWQESQNPDLRLIVLGVLVLLLVVTVIGLFRRDVYRLISWNLALNILIISGLWIALSTTTIIWGEERFDKPRLAQQVVEVLDKTTPLIAYQVNEAVFVHYVDRHISPIQSFDEIRRFVDSAPQQRCGLLTTGSTLESLSEAFRVTTVANMKNGKNSIEFVILKSKIDT